MRHTLIFPEPGQHGTHLPRLDRLALIRQSPLTYHDHVSTPPCAPLPSGRLRAPHRPAPLLARRWPDRTGHPDNHDVCRPNPKGHRRKRSDHTLRLHRLRRQRPRLRVDANHLRHAHRATAEEHGQLDFDHERAVHRGPRSHHDGRDVHVDGVRRIQPRPQRPRAKPRHPPWRPQRLRPPQRLDLVFPDGRVLDRKGRRAARPQRVPLRRSRRRRRQQPDH